MILSKHLDKNLEFLNVLTDIGGNCRACNIEKPLAARLNLSLFQIELCDINYDDSAMFKEYDNSLDNSIQGNCLATQFLFRPPTFEDDGLEAVSPASYEDIGGILSAELPDELLEEKSDMDFSDFLDLSYKLGDLLD